MSRWIDADAVERTLQEMEMITAMSHIEFGEEGDDIGEISIPMFTIRNIMRKCAPIDIVRCKECKNNYNKVLNHGKMKPRCDFTDRVLTENDFCSRGEREGE